MSNTLLPSSITSQPLTTAVKRCLAKHHQKPKKSTLNLLSHAHHILQTLTTKRHSLTNAIASFQSLSSHQTLSIQNNIPKLLQHWFSQYLRLRDGLVLLESGECRHSSDKHTAKMTTTRFPSQLQSGGVRGDGYTRLFRAECYSGFGWDEFFNEEKGVRRRLCENVIEIIGGKNDEQRRERVWERLMERFGGAEFERELDEHYSKVKSMTQDLEKVRNDFVSRLEKMKGRVSMSVKDKFERLKVMFGESVILMERQGDKFQILDKGGVLPNGMGKQEWMDLMRFRDEDDNACFKAKNKSRHVKNRRVIDEDDEDDDNDINICPTTKEAVGVGLKIQVKNSTHRSDTTKEIVTDGDELSISLTAIKTQLGIDQQALQNSREILETEEQAHAEPECKNNHDQEIVNEAREEIMEITEQIEEKKEELKHWKNLYQKILAQGEDDQIWDAREHLRECTMQCGILLLSLHSTSKLHPSLPDTASHLIEAEALFQNALSLIQEQQEQSNHHNIIQNMNNIQETLLLLRGRALINLGISLVEQYELSPHSKKFLHRSIESFQSAEESGRTIQTNLVVKTDPEMEMEAKQLECLAGRWHAIALNNLGRQRNAISILERFTKLVSLEEQLGTNVIKSSNIQTLLYFTERYHTAMYLTDICTTFLESMPFSSKSAEDVIVLARRGYQTAAVISSNMPSDFKSQYEISDSKELLDASNELKEWWEERRRQKHQMVNSKRLLTSVPERNLKRGDLAAESRERKAPSFRMAVPTGRRRANAEAGREGCSSAEGFVRRENGGVSFGSGRFWEERRHATVIFRKWGDELLPQVEKEGGGYEALMPFPACAPSMPEELKQFMMADS